MSGIGHNRGPSMEKGRGWRRHAWTKARAELLPKMPIEVVRLRVKRARELGIDYKAYAGIRAATGRDVIALLFSDNALRIAADSTIQPDRATHLDAIRDAECFALVHSPLHPEAVVAQNPALVSAARAPTLHASWGEIRKRILELKGKTPADGVVVVGETWLERDWSEAARLAGFIPSARYFTAEGS